MADLKATTVGPIGLLSFVQLMKMSQFRTVYGNNEPVNSFIPGYFYSAPSNPLLLRGAHDYSTNRPRSFTQGRIKPSGAPCQIYRGPFVPFPFHSTTPFPEH